MTRRNASLLGMWILFATLCVTIYGAERRFVAPFLSTTTAFPGSGHDFNIEMFVNGIAPVIPGILDAASGDELTIEVASPGGSLVGAPFDLATEGVPTGGGSPLGNLPANTYLDLGSAEIISDPKNSTSFGFSTVTNQGTVITLQIPPGLAGMDFMFQGFAFDPVNQVVATSDGFLLKIQ